MLKRLALGTFRQDHTGVAGQQVFGHKGLIRTTGVTGSTPLWRSSTGSTDSQKYRGYPDNSG